MFSLRQFIPLLLCYFSSFLDFDFDFFCTSSLNLLKYWCFLGFCPYNVVSLIPHALSVFLVFTIQHIYQGLPKLCLVSLSLSLILASRMGAGSGQRVLYSISFSPHNSLWGMSRYHSTCISHLSKLWRREVQEHAQGLMSYMLAGQTYLDVLQASLSQYCQQ